MALQQKPFVRRFWQQFKALLSKNVLVTWRNRRASLMRLLAPCVFILLVLLVDYVLREDQSNSESFRQVLTPDRTAIKPIQACESDTYITTPCFDFFYSPTGNPAVESIVDGMLANNDPPIDRTRIKGFASIDAANEWLLANPERTDGGIHFLPAAVNPAQLDFYLQINTTTKFFRGRSFDVLDFAVMPLQSAAHREIIRYHAGEALGAAASNGLVWDLGWKLFPHPLQISESLIGITLGLFLFASSMFGFVLSMTGIVTEREQRITQALRTIGMMRSAYWASWVVWEGVLALLLTLITLGFGAAVQIDFFLNNNFWLLFFTFFLFQLAMVSFAFLLASFLRKGSQAILLGFAVWIVGFIIQLVVAFDIPYTEEYYTKWGGILTIIFSAMPWAPFMKAVNDLGEATRTDSDPGISWANRNSYCDGDCRFPLPLAFGVLAIEFVGYLLLAIYFSAVIPDADGASDGPLFFLRPSFWSPKSHRASRVSTRHAPPPPLRAAPDPDVVDEEARMRALLQERDFAVPRASDTPWAVECYGLQRVFRGGGCCCGGCGCGGCRGGGADGDFWAVRETWLAIARNQLFCLLGPNGAGKSTTINILTGVLPPSGGDAVIAGESITSPGGMDDIRGTIGVCPQFDVLWNELTGVEHMRLYARLKGLKNEAEVKREADALLAEVHLSSSARVRTGAFSGGMKRRLSVALALIGDPSLVFLDEPTTGMDPVSRRQVWDIIERAKQSRAVVLTTHSMEEADILGDRIAIMARGSLRCLGTSIRLKQKFGAGYQIAVSVVSDGDEGGGGFEAADLAAALKDAVRGRFGLVPVDETRAYVTYRVPRSRGGDLPQLLQALEADPTVTDIQIALTTLEEVFLNIARTAEVEAAAEGATVVAVLPDGSELEVPVGAETATDPTDNSVWRLSWGQDDHGALMVTWAQRVDGTDVAAASPNGVNGNNGRQLQAGPDADVAAPPPPRLL